MQNGLKRKIQSFIIDKKRHKIWKRAMSLAMALVVFSTTYALILPAITLAGTAYCGLDEHTHTDSCYTMEELGKKTIVCTPGEEAEFIVHTHDDLCYDEGGELICSLTEREAHTHGDSCYDAQGELTCDKVEVELYVHDYTCYARVGEDGTLSSLIETDTILEGDVLTCPLPQIISHQHSEDCIYVDTSQMESRKVLTCQREEHAHTDQCYKEPEALTFTYENGEISGVITLAWSEKLPDDLTCTVLSLTEEEEAYEDMLSSVDQTLSEDGLARKGIVLYQLKWESNGKEYTLPDGVVPEVQMTLSGELASSGSSSLSGVILNDYTSLTSQKAQAVTIKRAVAASAAGQDPAAGAEEDERNVTAAGGVTATAAGGATATAAGEEDAEDAASGSQAAEDTEESFAYSTSLLPVEDNVITISSVGMTSTFGLVSTRTQNLVKGDYYRRVTTEADLQALTKKNDSEFVFVFTNGMYALEGVCMSATTYMFVYYPGFKLHAVELQQVQGNPDYVQIVEVYPESGKSQVYNPTDYKSEHYTIKYPHDTNPSAYLLQEMGQSAKAWFYLKGGKSSTFSDWIRFQYVDDAKAWYLYTEENGYLTCNVSGGDTSGNLLSQGTVTTSPSASLSVESSAVFGNSDVLIYVYENTTLDVADDITDSESLEDSTIIQTGKPTYSSYQSASSAVSVSEDSSGYTGASDKATSNIETLLGATGTGRTLEEQKANDGRIVTDKSVIYGKDDYSAYDSYESGEFSVTLSALGQEWTLTETEDMETPMDVVFVVDFSGSTAQHVANPNDTEKPEAQRWEASVDAINYAIKKIQERNSENRVGVVSFSNYAHQVLPLGRYVVSGTQDTDMYLWYDSSKLPYDSYDRRQYLGTNVNLCYEKEGETGVAGEAFPYTMIDPPSYLTGSPSGIWGATYTQLGLQEAYETFQEVEDTTVTYGEGAKAVTITRQPVIVLVTDGEPTLGTYNYTNPSAGPDYGTGDEGGNGVIGFYTIMSANYFKNMVGIHYNKKAVFYSLGIGIKEEGNGNYDLDASGGAYADVSSDDSYRRAVMNPTSDNIAALIEELDYTYATAAAEALAKECWQKSSVVLYNLLTRAQNGSYGGTMVQNVYDRYVTSTSISVPDRWLRGQDNPYAKRNKSYCYTDGAFFGNQSAKQMEANFDQIIQQVQVQNHYGFLLAEGSSVVMTDPIGDGMEVKGTPVLRYYNQNYSSPTVVTGLGYVEYTWNVKVTRQTSDSKGEDDVVDLSVIKARIITAADGSQTVKFTIPQEAMPTLYPDLYHTFYYEELPVRLIYKVGMTEEAVDQAATSTVRKVYYTNKYDAATGAALTTVEFTPDSSNQYYTADFETVVNSKTANTTGTSAICFTESAASDSSGVHVTQTLGNNGKLTVEPSVTAQLTVTKKWKDNKTTHDPITVTVYRISEKGFYAAVYETITLSEGNWTATIDIPSEVNGVTYTYYVGEETLADYNVGYLDTGGNAITPSLIRMQNGFIAGSEVPNIELIDAAQVPEGGAAITIVNSKPYSLVEAGGPGTGGFLAGGVIILLFGCVLFLIMKKPKFDH